MGSRWTLTVVTAVAMPFAAAARADLVTTTTGTSGADAYIESGNPTTNFGLLPNVVVKDTDSDGSTLNRKGYVRFDLSAFSGPVTNASFLLPVTVNDGGGGNTTPQRFSFRVYGLNDGSAAGGGILGEDWTESALTWNNAPANLVSGTGASNTIVTGTGTTNGGQATLLGTFAVVDGPGKRMVALSGGTNSRLVSFLNADTNKKVTFVITRNSYTNGGGTPAASEPSSNSAFAAKDGSAGTPALYLNQGVDGVRATSVVTDATWRVIGTTPATGWNTSVSFNDSNAAGWQDAFKSPSEDNIWITSNQSGSAPNNAYFRKVFRIDGPVASASGHFYWDDYGEVYINGTLVASRSTGGAGSVDLVLDPSLFVQGDNLIAVHGLDATTPFNNISDTLVINMVPEPGTAALAGLAGSGLLRRRVRRRKAIAPV